MNHSLPARHGRFLVALPLYRNGGEHAPGSRVLDRRGGDCLRLKPPCGTDLIQRHGALASAICSISVSREQPPSCSKKTIRGGSGMSLLLLHGHRHYQVQSSGHRMSSIDFIVRVNDTITVTAEEVFNMTEFFQSTKRI
ncbi:MAG TPA: hypothetical protein VH678_29980 [Xanthobacteraceae bacterium]